MRILLTLPAIFLSLASFAQKKEVGKAITTEGRRIILYDDGSWRYELEPIPVSKGTAVPDTAEDLYSRPIGGQFQKSPYNKKEWRSNRTNFSIWFNSKKWKMNLMNNVPPTEVSFHFIANVCNVLTEKVDVDIEKWIHDTKLFRKQNYPSMRVQIEEWRTVNGLNVFYMKWQTGDNRTNLQCYSYFAKSSFELVQMTISTPIVGAADAEEEIFRLLNGLVLNE